MSKELDHVINAVRESVVYDYPYDYCYITNFFSDSFYDELLKNLPSTDKFKRKKYGSEKGQPGNRYQFKMSQSGNEIIQQALTILKSKELQDVYFTKFKDAIIRHRKTDKISVSCTPIIVRDKKGYSIDPHPDVVDKVITTQIYLPEDNIHENIGTIINIKEGEQFINYKQLKFHRNTSYALVRSKNSWHSVDTLKTEDNFDRNSIQFTYYKDPEN